MTTTHAIAARDAVQAYAYQCARHGHWESADALYDWLVQRYPDQLPYRLGLAYVCLARMQASRALEILEPVEDAPSAPVHLLMSRALAMLGRSQAACVEFAVFATLPRRGAAVPIAPPRSGGPAR